jgi:hypothetical protein
MTDKERILLKHKCKLVAKRLAGFEGLLRGSVVLMKRRCSYPRCRRCAAGDRHPTWVLTQSVRGKTRTFYLGSKRLAKARELVENYRRLMGLVEQIAEANRLLLIHPEAQQKGPKNARGERGP